MLLSEASQFQSKVNALMSFCFEFMLLLLFTVCCSICSGPVSGFTLAVCYLIVFTCSVLSPELCTLFQFLSVMFSQLIVKHVFCPTVRISRTLL